MPRITAPAPLRLALVALLASSAPLLAQKAPERSPSTAPIDADVWNALAASAAASDIVAMGKVYHPDAVLVSAQGTQSIKSVLPRWGKDFADGKARGAKSSVELRFSMRQDDTDTAFEQGAFRFAVTEKDGTSKPGYRRFESLLVKQNGKWRVIMERQLDAITEAEFNRMPKLGAR